MFIFSHGMVPLRPSIIPYSISKKYYVGLSMRRDQIIVKSNDISVEELRLFSVIRDGNTFLFSFHSMDK